VPIRGMDVWHVSPSHPCAKIRIPIRTQRARRQKRQETRYFRSPELAVRLRVGFSREPRRMGAADGCRARRPQGGRPQRCSNASPREALTWHGKDVVRAGFSRGRRKPKGVSEREIRHSLLVSILPLSARGRRRFFRSAGRREGNRNRTTISNHRKRLLPEFARIPLVFRWRDPFRPSRRK